MWMNGKNNHSHPTNNSHACEGMAYFPFYSYKVLVDLDLLIPTFVKSDSICLNFNFGMCYDLIYQMMMLRDFEIRWSHPFCLSNYKEYLINLTHSFTTQLLSHGPGMVIKQCNQRYWKDACRVQ